MKQINNFYSQAGQDKWICDLFKNKLHGTYVDIGAYDGIQSSNTYVLEKELFWSGICVEPNKDIFKKLELARPNAINYNLAINNRVGQVSFLNDRVYDYSHAVYNTVECDTLYNILLDANMPETIDYLSIDIEGMEYLVLDFFIKTNNVSDLKFNFNAITVEHNLYCEGPTNKNLIYDLLSNNGYTRIFEDVKCLDPNPAYYGMPYEDWYINNNFKL